MLCKRCKNLELFDRYPSLREITLNDGQVVLDSNLPRIRLNFEYQDSDPNFPKLQLSAQKGCEFCSLLRASLQDVYPNAIKDHTVGRTYHIWDLNYTWDKNDYQDSPKIRNNDKRRWNGISRLDLEAIATYENDKHSLSFDIVADEGSSASKYLRIHRRRLSETLSVLNIAAMRSWIKNCLNHEHCTRDTFIPTRLIDLGGDDQNIRLVITSEDDRFSNGKKSPSYLALSYCWGPPDISSGPLKTETSSLSSRLQSIPLEIVPKTIADSFTVTRALGHRFIWIDSLCIIQDDEADWQKESTYMWRIFGSAMVTLVATSSRSANDGFLERRKAELIPVPYRRTRHPKQAGHFYLQRSHNSNNKSEYLKNLESGEWHTRGWTLQEDVASQCLLYFGPTMLHYRCQQEIRSENTRAVLSPYELSISWGRDLRHHDVGNWTSVVEDYSGRKLTYPSDKLPALSALAHDVKERINSRYLAGLWEKDIVWNLLWENREGTMNKIIAPVRCETYRAPSWSWAAGDGFVSWVREFKPLTWKEEVVIVEAKTVTTGDNPLGCVTDGSLTLTGKVLHVSLVEDDWGAWFDITPSALSGCVPRTRALQATSPYTSYVNLDWSSPPDVKSGIQEKGVWLLRLASFYDDNINEDRELDENNYDYRSAGLVLSHVDFEEGNPRKFKRVGMFCFRKQDDPEIFRGSPTETITII